MNKLRQLTFTGGAALLLAAYAASAQEQNTTASDPNRTSSSTTTENSQVPSQSATTERPDTMNQSSTAQQTSGTADDSNAQDTSTQSNQQQRSTRQAASSRASQDGVAAVPFVMFVVPMQQANTAGNPAQNGCWAKLYEGQNYTGDSFTLVGPVDLENMTGPFGVDWEDVSSIQVGPKASVTIYDNRNFRDKAATIRSGQNVPELSDRLGFFEEVESLRINCAQSQPAAG